jgi:membrane-bound lytic murein transglycosylase MltF
LLALLFIGAGFSSSIIDDSELGLEVELGIGVGLRLGLDLELGVGLGITELFDELSGSITPPF